MDHVVYRRFALPNPVGYSTSDLNAGRFYLMGVQFTDVAGDAAALSKLIGGTLSAGTFDNMDADAPQIQVLNADGTGYDFYYYIEDAMDAEGEFVQGWATAGGDLLTDDEIISTGSGFWMKAPVQGAATMSGAVESSASVTLSIPAGRFSIFSNPYPVALSLAGMTTGLEAGTYDGMDDDAPQVQVLNADGSGYDFYYYIEDAMDAEGEFVQGWSTAGGDLVEGTQIDVSAGAWIKTPNAGTITFAL